MTSLLTIKSPENVNKPDMLHYVCCFDQNIAICGEIDFSSNIVYDSDPADCVVCEDLSKQEFCPIYKECKGTE